MNPWDNDPVDQPLKVEINGTAADVPPEPWNADPIDEQPDVRAGTVPAVDVDPEKAARARALAQATGIPASILEEDPAPAERRLKLEQLDAAAAADPAVASVLSDPETAKLAHDDVENLSLVGETVRSFGRFFGAIGAAIPQVNAGLWGVVRAGADIVGLDAAAAYAAERQGEQRGFVQDLRPQTGNWVLDAAYSGVTSAAQSALMAPAGAAGLLTGFGLTTGGDAYGQARDAGKGVGESLAFGASQGVIEAGTEMLPAGAFLRMMKGEAGGAVLKTIKEFAAKEAIGEQVATALQDLNEWAVLHPERPFSEYLAERPGAAAETLISTIVSVGASTTAAQALQAYGERAQRGVEAAKEAEQLLKASAASQLRARDPEAFRKFLTEASTDENGDESTFFIDGRAFAQAIGSTGVSFEEFRARAPELAQQMIDAVQTGGDIEIPVADFATAFAGTQEGATLLQHVRTSPDAASAAEAAVFAQTQPEVLQQEIERATAEAVGEEVGQRSETTVRDRILQQLQSTGRYNDEVAGINAQVAASMFTALGAKMGRTAEQVMADFPLRIVGENPAAPGEVLNATDDPQFKAWFGASKVVDESGAPLRVFHGTNANFDEFDPDTVGRNYRQSSGGFFFTTSKDSAESYAEDAANHNGGAPRVAEVYLSLRDPLVVSTEILPEMYYDENVDALLAAADEGGHDGIVVRGWEDENTPRTVYVAFDPTQIKSVFNRGTWDANDPNILNQRAPSSRFEVRREKASGRYVGAPDWVGSSPQKLAALRKSLKKLAEEGRAGQFWYEDSARAVMDLVGGDKAEAEKFIALLAIYSQGTDVSANVTFALTAYYQWKAGLPINTGRFPSSQSAKAEAVLRRNEGWGGIKTNNFYNDLMEEIDPSKMDEEHATMDMWMAIAFDYGSDKLDQGPKYGFAKAIIQSLADEMGVRPHQVQAMIWTAIKYRVESTEGKRREIERKRGIQVQAEDGSWVVPKEKEYDHFRLAFKLAMQAPLDQEGMNASKFDFGDALRDRMVMISWEAAPSTSPGRSLPGIHTAPLEQQFEYLAAVRRATSDENGRDLIADLAGLPQGSTVEGFGAWQAMVRAGAQTMLAVPSEGAGKTRTVRPVAKELLDLYSAIRGYVLEQDAVVYHTPVWDDAKIRHNGVHLSTARPLHAEEVRMLYSALHEKFGTWELAPGWRPDGARILNFVEGLDNKDFQKGLAEVVAALPEDFGGGDVSAETFRSDGDYIGNDWQENPNGEAYLARIAARQPDLLGRVAELRASVEAVNAQFAARYGWDRAEAEGERGDERAGDGRAVPSAAVAGESPATGIHFSHAARTSLDGRYYGTGIRGREAERVFASEDRRLRERVYAYLNLGAGVSPEAGLGPVAHEVMLPTLYDPSKDPLGLWSANDLNGSEAAILDAGYHGYFIRDSGMGHGVAVVIGSASRGLQAKVIDAPPTVAPATGRRPFAGKYRTQLTSKEMDALDPHMDEVRAAAPSASLSFGTFMAEEGEAQAAREVAAKYGVALPEQSLEQPVYHGTPHEFEAFSFDEIGSGEGAQVFGWGLYFAESRGVAAEYRRKLASNTASYTVDGKEVWNSKTGKYGTPEHIVALALYDGDAKRIHDLVSDYRRVGMEDKAAGLEAKLREWEGKPVKQIVTKGGTLFRADVPDEAIGRMLLWDERFEDQPETVKAAFSEAFGGDRQNNVRELAWAASSAFQDHLDELLPVLGEDGYRALRDKLNDSLSGTDDERTFASVDKAILATIDAFNAHRAEGTAGAIADLREVSKRLRSIEDTGQWAPDGSATGESLYKRLAMRLGSDEEASKFLAERGVPGNRYLDGGSRGKGGGTYNTVVWDQALLDQMNEQLEKEVAQRQEAPRGTFNPLTLTISLLEKADLSTFLHELGHFGLEMMVEIASQPAAPQTVVDDVRTILDWFGIKDIQSWRAMTLDEQRPYHEQFAEGFETYLFEGKSPSAELNGAFARIAAWMLNVYKSLTSMRVKLTPEVRGVFDRMLATNDQIAEQSRLRNMAPLFSDPSQAGMSAKDWLAYQEVGAQAARDAVADLRTRTLRDMRWMANAKGRALKKLQDSAKEVRRGVRAEVEEQVDAQPVYAAMAFIERGTMADRDLTNAQRAALDTMAGGKTKLSLPALKELYGDGPSAPWRYIKQTLVAAEDGADPDAVAAAFGFDSGDALVRAILSAEPRQQLVEALTDKRMLEEHADLSDPVQIELAAEEAIHNEARIRFVATEMKALQEGMNVREKVGETKVRKGKNAGQTRALTVDGLVRAATQYAEQIVGRTVVRRLSPTKHARAAANEAKAAAEAMKAGDLQTALAHKRNQLLHERTSKAMSEAITTFEKNLGYLRKFRRSNRARGSIDADYVEQIENLLNAIDTRSQTNKRLDSINSLKKWIAAQEAEGLPVTLDAELIESLQIANVRDLTVDQLQALVDQVKSIEHLGKLKKKLLTARDKREFDAIADELAATIREHGGKPREVPFAPGAHEHRFKRLWEGFFAEHRKLASLARQMDGVVDDGPMWRALIRGMNDAGNRETSLIAQSTKALADIFRPIAKMKGGLTGNKLLIPALGQSLSRGERMAVLLNWGNELSRQRVLNTVPLAAVEQIMATMSREEALAIQAVWDHINEYWPDIAAKEKRVKGVAPEKVDALPFTMVLADGTSIEMRGGYYPLVYESEMSDVAAAHEQAQVAKDMQAGAYTRATTRRGHTKKRAEKVGEPLRFTLDVIDRHISQVVHDLAWHEWLIDAGRLLRDKRISSAIRDHYGPATLKAMKDTLSDIATGDLQRMSRVEALAAGVRARTSAAVMGWSLTTALLQPFGLFQSVPRVGAVWILRGMKHWAGDALRLENSARLIREKSAMMRHRSTTFNRDIREVTARIHQGKGPIAEAFDASLFIAMQKLQLIADIPTWWGAYEKALAEVDDEGRAVALADQAVLDAQGGGQVKDLAGVQRGNELKRALSMFYSYFSATWNMASESTARTSFRKPAQVAGWLADMIVLSVIPVLAQQMVFAAFRGGDDDKDWEERMLDLFKQLGAFWMNTLIGVREFSGMVQGFDYNGPAAARAIVEAGNVGKAAGKALDPDEDLDDNDYRRVLKSVLTILGWPAAQVDRSWRGWKAWEEGEAGPGAILLGPPPKD